MENLEPSPTHPHANLISDRESRSRTPLKPAAKVIGVDLQWNAIVPAAAEESANVKLSESCDAELAILLDVNKLVKQ